MDTNTLLVLNGGSSSIKANIYDFLDPTHCLVEMRVENIGVEGTRVITKKKSAEESTEYVGLLGFTEAVALLFERMRGIIADSPVAIGYRVVHGGTYFTAPTVIDDAVIDKLRELVPLDPMHMPGVLQLISAANTYLPGRVHVACFDTSFYSELPRVAQIIPIPRRYEATGVRRYGFHGLSYSYLLNSFREICGEDAAQGRIIMAHLGSGASLTALHRGKPLDTTMGLSPASGIPMSTRSGDIDPGVVSHLHAVAGLDFEDINTLLNEQSGLLGVSETTPDMYELLQNSLTDVRASEAVELFCYQVKKTIGAFSAVLGGVDSIVFSGGMGENAPIIRKNILVGLEYLGAYVDDMRNERGDERISSDTSRVGLHILHTDESQVIARQVTELLKTNTII